jgi:hypothetical protein
VLGARPSPSRLVVLVLVTAALSACNRETRADGGAFCEAVRTEQASLTAGVAGPEQASAMVARYRELEELAPVAVRDEWGRITDLLETAATTPTGDAEAVAELAQDALAAAQDVDTVTTWVRTTCGVDLRPGFATDQPVPPALTTAPPPSEG